MRIRRKTIYFLSIAIGFLFILLIISQHSSAFEPKLLWKKEIPSLVEMISFARGSGDIIFTHGEKNRLSILDKNGNYVWQWGPVPKTIVNPAVALTEDGKYFVYSSSAWEKSGYVHYCERNGKEIWRYKYPAADSLSPNGKYVFMSLFDEEGPSVLLDSNAKILWKKNIGEVQEAEFTSDNSYLVYSSGEMGYPDIYLFNISEKTHEKIGTGSITSLSNDGTYIGIEIGIYATLYEKEKNSPAKEGIFNKDGILILEGKNTISENGEIVISHFENKIEIKHFPSGVKIEEYPIQRWKYPRIPYCRLTKLSSDGKYVAIFGKRTDKNSTSNLFLIDTMEGSLWEETIENVDENDSISLFITKDGKFLFIGIRKKGKSTFYFYQIY
jgi:DNA-binding beta-propeller fold protein YncE